MKPRVRRTIEITLSDSLLHFHLSTTHVEKTFDRDPVLVEFLKLLDGSRTVPELIVAMWQIAPAMAPEDINNVLGVLSEEGLIEDAEASRHYTEQEVRRYGRQIAFFEDLATPEDAFLAQQRLHQAHVVIFGIGGLGNWIAAALAMAGVGEITLCDGDCVEESNLNRQGIYRFSDVGRPKVEALADHLLGLNPQLKVHGHRVHIGADTDLAPFMQRASLIINCMDEPNVALTGLWVSRAALALGIPHQIGGGYNGHLGLIGPTILPGKTGCWNCLLESHNEGDKQTLEIPNLRQRAGTVGPITALVANLHAWESLRVLTGIVSPMMTNRKMELDLNTLEWHAFHFDRLPHCRYCGQVEA